MGHVLLLAPRIRDLALLDALVRVLLRRQARVSVLATDRVTANCLESHGIAATRLVPERRVGPTDPSLDDFVRREARLVGDPSDPRLLRRCHDFLARRTTPLVRVMETALPDLVVSIGGRGGLDRLVHATARLFGCATAHLGPGLLPGTLQRDCDGIDGDREPVAPLQPHLSGDRALIDDALAAALAGGASAWGPLPRVVFGPTRGDVLRAWLGAHRDGGLAATRARLRAWRDAAAAVGTPGLPPAFHLPQPPFTAVLLQSPDDPRVRLDFDGDPPDAADLVGAARAASACSGLGEHIVAVLDPAGKARAELRDRDDVTIVPAGAAALAAATAAAVVTLNHPRAFVGVLANTPTVCLGRAMFARTGLAHRAGIDRLAETLRMALDARPDLLTYAELTRVLRDEHVWCDRDRPDVNGLGGIATWLEQVLDHAAPAQPPVRYEAGPSWPGADDATG